MQEKTTLPYYHIKKVSVHLQLQKFKLYAVSFGILLLG